jgi:hypothetical protein
MFAGATLKPDYYSSKVNLFVALAPIAYLSHTTCQPFQTLSQRWWLVEKVVERMGAYDLMSPTWFEDQAVVEFCHIFGGICDGVLKAFMDTNTEVDNLTR